jgi:hypothetical protein
MALEHRFHLLFLEDLKVRRAPTVMAPLERPPGQMRHEEL